MCHIMHHNACFDEGKQQPFISASSGVNALPKPNIEPELCIMFAPVDTFLDFFCPVFKELASRYIAVGLCFNCRFLCSAINFTLLHVSTFYSTTCVLLSVEYTENMSSVKTSQMI